MYTADDITMMAIRFCEKYNILNRTMDLSMIECMRNSKKVAVESFENLINAYGGTKEERKILGLLKKETIKEDMVAKYIKKEM